MPSRRIYLLPTRKRSAASAFNPNPHHQPDAVMEKLNHMTSMLETITSFSAKEVHIGTLNELTRLDPHLTKKYDVICIQYRYYSADNLTTYLLKQKFYCCQYILVDKWMSKFHHTQFCRAFQCKICLQVTTNPVFLTCCKVIGGCVACFEQLARTNPLAPCPNCRESRVIGRFTEIRGLDEVLTGVRAHTRSGNDNGVWCFLGHSNLLVQCQSIIVLLQILRKTPYISLSFYKKHWTLCPPPPPLICMPFKTCFE